MPEDAAAEAAARRMAIAPAPDAGRPVGKAARPFGKAARLGGGACCADSVRACVDVDVDIDVELAAGCRLGE